MSNQDKISRAAQRANRLSESSHVVFFGVYNADLYRQKIEDWLPRLDLLGTELRVSDNASTDSTLEWLIPLVQSLDVPFSINTNSENLGGYGNLAANLNGMLGAKWVTTLHQDDVYQPGHIQSHRRTLTAASDALGMIFSEARSVDQDGLMIPYPRAHWLLDERADPIKVFLAHLRHHVYPFSGATFAMDVLKGFEVPANSTAFPDTELVMKMIVDYQVAQARGVSVDYLENPMSESHSMDSISRDLGTYQALIRVFSHSSFEKLCRDLHEQEVPAFFRAVASGIDLRFSHNSLAALVRQAAFEISVRHLKTTGTWKHDVSLDNAQPQLNLNSATDSASDQTRFTPKSARVNELQGDEFNGPSHESKRFLLKLARLLPRSVRRFLFALLMSTQTGKRIFPQWDFDWDKL